MPVVCDWLPGQGEPASRGWEPFSQAKEERLGDKACPQTRVLTCMQERGKPGDHTVPGGAWEIARANHLVHPTNPSRRSTGADAQRTGLCPALAAPGCRSPATLAITESAQGDALQMSPCNCTMQVTLGKSGKQCLRCRRMADTQAPVQTCAWATYSMVQDEAP